MSQKSSLLSILVLTSLVACKSGGLSQFGLDGHLSDSFGNNDGIYNNGGDNHPVNGGGLGGGGGGGWPAWIGSNRDWGIGTSPSALQSSGGGRSPLLRGQNQQASEQVFEDTNQGACALDTCVTTVSRADLTPNMIYTQRDFWQPIIENAKDSGTQDGGLTPELRAGLTKFFEDDTACTATVSSVHAAAQAIVFERSLVNNLIKRQRVPQMDDLYSPRTTGGSEYFVLNGLPDVQTSSGKKISRIVVEKNRRGLKIASCQAVGPRFHPIRGESLEYSWSNPVDQTSLNYQSVIIQEAEDSEGFKRFNRIEVDAKYWLIPLRSGSNFSDVQFKFQSMKKQNSTNNTGVEVSETPIFTVNAAFNQDGGERAMVKGGAAYGYLDSDGTAKILSVQDFNLLMRKAPLLEAHIDRPHDLSSFEIAAIATKASYDPMMESFASCGPGNQPGPGKSKDNKDDLFDLERFLEFPGFSGDSEDTPIPESYLQGCDSSANLSNSYQEISFAQKELNEFSCGENIDRAVVFQLSAEDYQGFIQSEPLFTDACADKETGDFRSAAQQIYFAVSAGDDGAVGSDSTSGEGNGGGGGSTGGSGGSGGNPGGGGGSASGGASAGGSSSGFGLGAK